MSDTATITPAPATGPATQTPGGIARCTHCGLVSLSPRRRFCLAARQCPRCLNGRLVPTVLLWQPTAHVRPHTNHL